MPRDRLYLFALLASAVLALPAAAEDIGVHWQQDIESAKSIARQSGRLVLVHVWADGCGPCHALESNVFNQPGVAGAVEAKFVPVKLNANEFPAIAQGFGITRVPMDVILTPDGRVIGKMISPSTPMAYVAEIGQVANQYASQTSATQQSIAAVMQQSRVPNQAYANLPIGSAAIPSAPTSQAPPNASAYTAAPQQADNWYATTAPPSIPKTPVSSPAAGAPPMSVPNSFAAVSAPGSTTAPTSQNAAAPAASQNNPYIPSVPATPVAMSPSAGPPPQTPPSQVAAIGNPSAQTITNPTATMPTGSAVPTPNTRQLPPGAPPLAFDGYCPVSMRSTWKWVPGDARWGAIHRGRTYWFAGPNEQQQFLTNPDFYAPALSGIDPVLALDHRQTVPGMREHSLDYDNQFYMFSSEATLQQFTANPERYAAGVRQAMGMKPGRQMR